MKTVTKLMLSLLISAPAAHAGEDFSRWGFAVAHQGFAIVHLGGMEAKLMFDTLAVPEERARNAYGKMPILQKVTKDGRILCNKYEERNPVSYECNFTMNPRTGEINDTYRRHVKQGSAQLPLTIKNSGDFTERKP